VERTWHSYNCDQTVGWIKMPLGKEVVLGPGHIVFIEDPLGTQAPQLPLPTLWPMSIVALRSPILATAELLLHIWKWEWMPSTSKLFTYLFYMWHQYDVTVTFMTLMSCDSVRCMCGYDQPLIDDAVECIIKVWNVMFHFAQGSVSTLFWRGEHVFHVCVKMFFLVTAVQKL